MIRHLKNNLNFKKWKNQGFTLIETFVAITVLMIVVIGPLSVLTKMISDGLFAQNQITASYLAQEGMDMIINIRDTYTQSEGQDYDPFQNLNIVNCFFPQLCIVDYTGGQVKIQDSVSDYYLYQNLAGEYSHSPMGAKTVFERKIWFTQSGLNPDEIKVFVQVNWKNKNVDAQPLVISRLLYK